AAGWFAGYAEAKMNEPKVKDFESLSKLNGITDFWRNRVTRILLVVVLANLGSTLGTFIALPYLASLL
ncbi:MAG: TraB family protein, partial [Candidatus Aenigmarchaeota archaeon]|nr:TraB family protein [Candidatus Aenigmarchaeota archaeon]